MLFFKEAFLSKSDPSDAQILFVAPFAGQLTGATSAFLTNPLSLIKYRQYGLSTSCSSTPGAFASLRSELLALLRSPHAFKRGLYATVLRDSIFGCAFTTTRVACASSDHQFAVNMGAASFATVLAGPFNYARNQQFAWRNAQKSGNFLSL